MEPAFGSVDGARSVLGTVMGRYNEVVRALDAAPEEFVTAHLRCGASSRAMEDAMQIDEHEIAQAAADDIDGMGTWSAT